MIRFIAKRPWILIVIAFAILISGWIFLLRLARENQPETVPLKTVAPHSINSQDGN